MNKVKFYFVTSIMIVSGALGFVKVSTAETKAQPQAEKAQPQAKPAQKTTQVAIKTPKKKTAGVFSKIHLADIISTLFYSLMGLAVALFGYKVYDIITPFDLRKELEVDQNTSLGIVVGSIILGLSLIIAASIMSP